MKTSKFLKDLVTTGFSQLGVILFGVIVLKIMTALLSPEDFGLYILIRRWEVVLQPVVTLNLGIGLARYVSFDKEKAGYYLHISLITTVGLSFLVSIVLFLFNKTFSDVFFNNPAYGNFILLLAVFLFANVLHLIVYSYFRGKMAMNTANGLRILFAGFPILLGGILLLLGIDNPSTLLYLFFLVYSLWAVVTAFYFLRKEFSLSRLKTILKKKLAFNFKENRSFFLFSLNRIPTLVFVSLIFSLPVFIATHRISLEAAGYMGIVAAVLRLLGIFCMPFNMIFLPKFSSLKKDGEIENIKHYSLIVLDFIFTFLPLLAVITFGLTRFVILIWFGRDYLSTVAAVAAAILFSVFYLGFALIRGILDGLFVFPFTNFINLAGFLTIGILSLAMGTTIFKLSLALGFGLLVLGVTSILVLVKKLALTVPWPVITKAVIISLSGFLAMKYIDGVVEGSGLGGLYSFAVCVSYRIVLVLAAWFFYWRKTLWYREVIKRIKTGKQPS